MAERIPRPEPVVHVPPPAPAPPPPNLRLLPVLAGGAPELAVVFKRSYSIAHARDCRLADEQQPLDDKGIPHDELAPGVPPSWRSLPDAVGFKTGTDLVVQASARAARPVERMRVAVRVEEIRHEALVIGRRVCAWAGARLEFTPPEPFTDIPLRYENAYGGRDLAFERALLAEVAERTPADQLRRVRPAAEAVFGQVHPLMYPRNRFGKGYVLDRRREAVEGRELPNLERPNDLLTPERILVPGPAEWVRQPVPIGFDFFDPVSFPRVGMLGLPPLGYRPGDAVPEVEAGLVPADFCRGNAAVAKPADLAKLLHPLFSRSASLGLALEFLKGNETVVLEGMDPAIAEFAVALPRERPRFTIAGLEAKPTTAESQIYQITIDLPARRLHLTWCGRVRLARAATPARLVEWTAQTTVAMDGGRP